VPFAGVDDYRAALRMHRSWVTTIALFSLAVIAALPVLIVATWLGVLPHMPAALRWSVDFLIAAVLVWMDAAHRLAGGRLRSQR
jgi:putative Ca2+/H+ antiporter (TMEM165/GDT1 family)